MDHELITMVGNGVAQSPAGQGHASVGGPLQGSVLVLIQFDVCEEIRLDELRKLIGSPSTNREPQFRHLAPDYVRFERPPATETVEAVVLDTGEHLRCTVNYYDYGVVSIHATANKRNLTPAMRGFFLR